MLKPFDLKVPDLVALLPDLRKDEGASHLLSKVSLLEQSTILESLDLYYCIHWVQIEAGINDAVNGLDMPEYVVRHMRRALEWCFSDEDWDAITLDT